MPVSPAKRQRERNKQEKQREKEQRRRERAAAPPRQVTPGEDPDIAGIIPGPQPIPEDY